MPVGTLTYSRLISTQSKNPKIAWMTGGGVLICDMNLKLLSSFYSQSAVNSDTKRLITEQTRKIIE
jgi:hypothetical protein